ncbi:MAG: hypothetical protein K6F99_07200, partial [Lachnospiraceae bacterium]|nr:hypothetical protein [Lachnospiraceae bacterium]
ILDIIIYYIYFLLTGRDGGIPTIIKDLTETVTLYGISVLWFLPALFLAEITFLAILKTAKKLAPIIALAVLIIALYLNNSLAALNAVHGNETWFFVLHLFLFAIVRSLICMGFVALGYYAAYIWQKIPGVSPTETGKYTVPADILIGINLLVTVFFLSRANGGVDLHYGVFGNNTFVYFLTALTGSFGIIFLCKATEGLKNKGPLRIFQYYGENSLVVMATHMDFYILYVSEVLAFHFIKYVNHAKSYIFNFMIVAFVLIAEIFMIEIINRFFPFILGKTKSKRKA